MFWEGFLRSLQGDLMVAIGALVLIGILYLLLLRFAPADRARNGIHRGAALLVLFVLVVVAWRAFSVGAANRTPRQDVDKSGVYDQMNSHKQQQPPPPQREGSP